MIKKLFKNAKGFIILLIVTVNTILWFCPLLSFAIVKFLIPFKSFQRLMINWTMAMASNWVLCNSKIFSINYKTHKFLEKSNIPHLIGDDLLTELDKKSIDHDEIRLYGS